MKNYPKIDLCNYKRLEAIKHRREIKQNVLFEIRTASIISKSLGYNTTSKWSSIKHEVKMQWQVTAIVASTQYRSTLDTCHSQFISIIEVLRV